MLRRLSFMFWYLGRPRWDSGISPPELLEYIESHPAGRAIDLGCGTGTNVVTLARLGWQVTGVDFVPRAVAIARRKARAAGVKARIVVGDVTRLRGISGPFDLALDLGCFHGVPDKEAYLDQLERVLAPGGSWLMYGFFNPDPGQSGPGLVDAELALAASRMTLVSRRDGTSVRGGPSAWFHYTKPFRQDPA
ncbi:MAG TPA: class I SAM-dependent methyltransferase [Anaerolineales bacterium]